MPTRLALLGGKPIGAPAQLRMPVFAAAAIHAASELLRSGQTVGLGRTSKVIAAAEAAISRYHGGREALLVNSGHAALMCALMGLEVGPGDEVITTPYTWGASVSCILNVGAIPVFVDVDPATGLLDASKIGPAVTRRTKAVLAVHLYGQPCDMPSINRVARKRGLRVIEDGSQSHGATIGGRRVGSFSDAAGFSCMGGKLLATAEAGYMLTPHKDVFWKAALMCQHYGRSGEKGFPDALKPYADSLVYTFRVSPATAVLFPSQIRRLGPQIAARQVNARAFREAMRPCRFIRFPDYPRGVEPSYHMLTMNYVPQAGGVRRDTILKALRAEGVGAFAYVPSPIYTWPRLQWNNYSGPVPMWMDPLRRAGTDYGSLRLGGCEHKIAHAIELGWNFYRPAAAQMKRLAAAFLKVQDNLAALAAWEKTQDGRAQEKQSATVLAARRAVAAYRRK